MLALLGGIVGTGTQTFNAATRTSGYAPGAFNYAFDVHSLYLNWDASIIKNIQMTETIRLQLRVEAFNVLNRANFSLTGAAQAGAGALFDINSTTFGRFSGTFSPRIVQLVGRFEF